MGTQKISISLPKQECRFIDHYQAAHHCKTRSEVILYALHLLQQAELEACYREASKEIDTDWDNTINDGLDKNETW